MRGHPELRVPARCFPRWYGLHRCMQNASSGVSTVFVNHRFGMPNHRHLIQLGLADSVSVPEQHHILSYFDVWAQKQNPRAPAERCAYDLACPNDDSRLYCKSMVV